MGIYTNDCSHPLVVGIILGFLSGLAENKFVNTFIAGAADLVGVA